MVDAAKNPGILALWAAEAEDRVAAFERSEIDAVSAESVFEEIEQQRNNSQQDD
jgi:predicted RNA methylase